MVEELQKGFMKNTFFFTQFLVLICYSFKLVDTIIIWETREISYTKFQYAICIYSHPQFYCCIQSSQNERLVKKRNKGYLWIDRYQTKRKMAIEQDYSMKESWKKLKFNTIRQEKGGGKNTRCSYSWIKHLILRNCTNTLREKGLHEILSGFERMVVVA